MPLRRHSLSILGLLFVLGACAAAQEKATDWPQFRGPTGLGTSTATGVPLTWGASDNLLWKVEPGAGNSTPIVVGDRIYLASYSGYNEPGQRGGDMEQLKRHVVCLDRATGKSLWKSD